MTETEYASILEHLDAASRILVANQGTLCDGDIRIRHLVSISGSETRRQLAQFRREQRAVLGSEVDANVSA